MSDELVTKDMCKVLHNGVREDMKDLEGTQATHGLTLVQLTTAVDKITWIADQWTKRTRFDKVRDSLIIIGLIVMCIVMMVQLFGIQNTIEMIKGAGEIIK